MWITLWHEMDNNGVTNYSDYVNMFRYVVARAKSQGVTNIIWTWDPTGYSSRALAYKEWYPGDDVVDWIAWDPYAHAPDNDFSRNVNETDTAPGGWTGFYNWATTPATLGASGNRPTAFSGAKPLMLAEFGVDFRTGAPSNNGKTDAEGATYINTIVPRIPDYPRLKAIVYWNSLTANGDYQIQRSGYPQSQAAFAAMIADPYFTLSTTVT